jgi:hypothetical protein
MQKLIIQLAITNYEFHLFIIDLRIICFVKTEFAFVSEDLVHIMKVQNKNKCKKTLCDGI